MTTTNDRLTELQSRRERAHLLANTSIDMSERRAAAQLTSQLDIEIHAAKQLARQASIEAELKRRLRSGFSGDDESFERLWTTKLRDEALAQSIKDAAARAQTESDNFLRAEIGGR